MQKSGCTAGCGCTNFKADAFKKEKCCNCFHNHYVEGGGAAAAPFKPPGPPVRKPAANTPAPAAAAGPSNKCPECDCKNFEPDAFKKEKCRNCFHSHPPGGAVKSTPNSPPATARDLGADKKVEKAAEKPASAPPADKPAALAKPAVDKAAADKAAADKAAADKAAADKAAADKAAAEKAAAEKAAAEKAAASKVETPKPRVEEKKAAPGPPASAANAKNALKIAWHQSVRSEQYQLDVADVQNLEQLDARLRSKEASLANKRFDYLCRGQVVPKVFWDIFRPEHLLPILFIQEDTDSSARNRNKAAIPGAPVEKKTGGFAPPSATTGFAVPSKVTFQKPVVKVAVAAPAAAATAANKAKVGFKADDAWFASRPALFS